MMPNHAPGDVTQLLHSVRGGDDSAEERLVALVYPELRRRARRFMRRERSDHTLQPTALVNEAYLRLLASQNGEWEDRTHFFAVASRVMRRVLVDHARRAGAVRRGGEAIRVELNEAISCKSEDLNRIIEVDRALRAFEAIDQRAARVVELRYFGGLTEEEIGSELGVAARTVKRDWDFARAWLRGYFAKTAVPAPLPDQPRGNV